MKSRLPPPVHRLPLYEHCASLRLVDYLCVLWPDRARRTVLDLFAKGAVRRAGKPVSPWCRVGEVEELSLHADLDAVPRMFSTAFPASQEELDHEATLKFLYEDERFVVIDKPPGLSVVPERNHARGSCLEILTRRELRARSSKPPTEYRRLRVVHRIDRWASGLVIMAKTLQVERRLAADFAARRVRKEYRALVSGVVRPSRIVVNCPVGPGRKGKMRARAEGRAGVKSALTTFEVLERFKEVSLVSAFPETGRQHQIRVHAWAMGHPLAIDPLYAVGPNAYQGRPLSGMERLTLHAYRYTLPSTWDEPRSFCCPLEEDFRAGLLGLRAAEHRRNTENEPINVTGSKGKPAARDRKLPQ